MTLIPYTIFLFLLTPTIEFIPVDCTKLPQSMNGKNLQQGCPGAAYNNGIPAKEYCQNDDGRYPWWQTCCFWNGLICIPKGNFRINNL